MTKNITLSADEKLIEEARKRAASENKSLNSVFRDWLYRYARGKSAGSRYHELMVRLKNVQSGHKFTRDELNER